MRTPKRLCWIAPAVLLSFLFVFGPTLSRPQQARVQLPDGRILQVESVTFGTEHRVGARGPIPLLFLAYWLNETFSRVMPMMRPVSQMHSLQPTLMVWVNAVDPTTGRYVDCQNLRMEIIGDQGERYSGPCRSAMAGANFWRCGHSFEVYPRTQRKLTLQISPAGTSQSARIEILNPHIVAPAVWSGSRLPQAKTVGNLELALSGLAIRTNRAAGNDWEAPLLYREPVWELRESGHAAMGWNGPEWNAEDSTGNRSRFLGVHQPVLRFDVKYYPSTTNTRAAVLIGTCPPVALDTLQSNIWWNLEIPYRGHKLTLLGLFPPGTHVFSDGKYVTNPPAWLGPVSDNRSSGWDGHTRGSPWQKQSWSRHHTPVATIYARATELGDGAHWGVRIRDERGCYWTTKLESNGGKEDRAYLLEVPPDVKTMVAEIVLLKPVQAQFFVRTTP